MPLVALMVFLLFEIHVKFYEGHILIHINHIFFLNFMKQLINKKV